MLFEVFRSIDGGGSGQSGLTKPASKSARGRLCHSFPAIGRGSICIPPLGLVAMSVQFAMMQTAQGDRKLIAHFAAQGG
jgi:hypothetical protein